MPPAEKRRRKKSRIQAHDSSSSESESASDVDMKNEELSAPSELSDAGEDAVLPQPDVTEPAGDEETPRERLRKAPKGQTSADFNQAFLRLVTEQFGEDLAALRQANDFGPASLGQLIEGLKQGVDIFTPEQQRML